MPQPYPTTIMMVDDNADEIFLTRRQLERDGIRGNFVEENKPERVLETLSQLADDGHDLSKVVVLLDINMPRLSGFDVLRNIRTHEQYRELLVIMLSASDDEADKTRAHGLGADGYMVKPMSLSTLQAILYGSQGGDDEP